jgi:hypothetical protein
VTRVKEDFITLCRPASCVENLIDDFVGPLLPHIVGDSERFCHLLRQRFDDTRKRKLNNSLLAIRKAASEDEQSVFTKLTEEARVQLRMLCVFLAALNLELSGSPRYFDFPSFFAVYPELVVAPESDVADLLRFRNYMAGERAFQPKKVEVGKSLKMCISLAHGSDKKYSTGGGVPKMERIAQFASGHRAVDWVARRQFIFYRETGTTPRSRPARDGTSSSSCSEPGVCSKRKTASWDVDSVSSLDDSVCAGKRRRSDSVSSGSTASVCEDAFLAFVGETDQLSGDFDVDDEESRVLSEFLADDDEETLVLPEFPANDECASFDDFDFDMEVFEVYPPHQ